MIMPTNENSELSHPAVAMSIPNAACSVVMQGATLFCTSASAIPARIVANATTQARFAFISKNSLPFITSQPAADHAPTMPTEPASVTVTR